MEPEHTELPAPSADERTFAMLAHFLQLFGGFVAPLVIFLIKRDSRFVAFHALQVLLWQVIYIGVGLLCVFGWIVAILSTIITQSGSASGRFPLPIVVVLPLVIVIFGGWWLTTMVLAIVYGIKANAGEWAEYPIVGGWARKLARA
jgi:uncharacterized Tic20 family protein